MPCISQNIPDCVKVEKLSIEVPFMGSTLLIESADFSTMRWDFDQLCQAAIFFDKEKALALIDEYEEQLRKTAEFKKYSDAGASPLFSQIPPSDSGPRLAKLVFEKVKGFEFSAKGFNFVFTSFEFGSETTVFYFEPITENYLTN